MSGKYYWIKERHNPQLGVYFVACGQISTRQARRHEKPLYGMNFMHRFSSKEEYEEKLGQLRADGKEVKTL